MGIFSFLKFFLSFIHPASGQKPDPLAVVRNRMVDEQITARGITDEPVLRALRQVPRHLFIPKNNRNLAYEDHPVSIGFGQTVSQPFIVGYMTEALQLKSSDKVLEIGTGSGYQAAVLAQIVKTVWTVEVIGELAQNAKKLLAELRYQNIHGKSGDGFKGWPEAAPFDAIMVTAAPEEIPRDLVAQLKIGGRMIIPVGDFYQELILLTRTATGEEKRHLLPVRFVPMVKRGGP